jgi:hypothetical protein
MSDYKVKKAKRIAATQAAAAQSIREIAGVEEEIAQITTEVERLVSSGLQVQDLLAWSVYLKNPQHVAMGSALTLRAANTLESKRARLVALRSELNTLKRLSPSNEQAAASYNDVALRSELAGHLAEMGMVTAGFQSVLCELQHTAHDMKKATRELGHSVGLLGPIVDQLQDMAFSGHNGAANAAPQQHASHGDLLAEMAKLRENNTLLENRNKELQNTNTQLLQQNQRLLGTQAVAGESEVASQRLSALSPLPSSQRLSALSPLPSSSPSPPFHPPSSAPVRVGDRETEHETEREREEKKRSDEKKKSEDKNQSSARGRGRPPKVAKESEASCYFLHAFKFITTSNLPVITTSKH